MLNSTGQTGPTPTTGVDNDPEDLDLVDVVLLCLADGVEDFNLFLFDLEVTPVGEINIQTATQSMG